MPASSKHKYSKLLAFPDTYYELIINLLQSVELFCAYPKLGRQIIINLYSKRSQPLTTDPHKLWQTLKKFDYPYFITDEY